MLLSAPYTTRRSNITFIYLRQRSGVSLFSLLAAATTPAVVVAVAHVHVAAVVVVVVVVVVAVVGG